MLRRIPRACLLAVPLVACLYFFGLTRFGLVMPDEPRYAAVGREMARSGDWITPHLWGQPWFEKPALLYWMSGAAFRLGLDEELAPRLPVAACAVAFLLFYGWILAREFGARAGWFATAVLGASAGWLGYAHVAVTDLPMAAAFSAAMLLAMRWIETGDTRRLPWAAALLGVAVLAKGLVPLVLALPVVWFGRKRLADLLKPQVMGICFLVAAPWYVLCTLRNGSSFLAIFFGEHHFGRFASAELQHPQPFWFYLPVMAAALLPWSPLLAMLFRRSLYFDARRRFLFAWAIFGLIFFSLSVNKLPGYLLPLLPAAAALMGIALAESKRPSLAVALSGICLLMFPLAAQLLPAALASGLSRAGLPHPDLTWIPSLVAAAMVAVLERVGRREVAVAAMAIGVSAGVVWLVTVAAPAVDRTDSARLLWRSIADRRDSVCVGTIRRGWRYGLNYYSVTPLPDCEQQPRLLRIEQRPGEPPSVLTSPARSHPSPD